MSSISLLIEIPEELHNLLIESIEIDSTIDEEAVFIQALLRYLSDHPVETIAHRAQCLSLERIINLSS